MTTKTAVDHLVAPILSFADHGRLLLARVPGLTRYHQDRLGHHAPCYGAGCPLCAEGFHFYKAAVYFVLTLKDRKVKVVLLDDREPSIKNRRTKRTFQRMLKDADPCDRQFVPWEYGIVRMKIVGAAVPGDGQQLSVLETFSTYADQPEVLLQEYFYYRS